MKKLKYLSIFSLPLSVLISFNFSRIWTFLPVIIFFIIVPLLELILKPNPTNLEVHEKELVEKDTFYDWMLYVMMPLQWIFIFYFLVNVPNWDTPNDFIGRIISMGTMCGIIGINVGHELGHRMKSWERFIGEALLFTSLENHFLPYHNRGHHTNVGTPEDPATARKNEPLYIFWIRSHFGSYIQAWKIEFQRMKIIKKPWFHWSNKMMVYSILYIIWLSFIYFFYGNQALKAYLWAAAIGIILLETVNYIEHYGLMRKQRENGTYETVKRWHSWNSNHVIGRVVLFELSRHSDHHFKADRPYQLLESHEQSPTMPTGYPGMMLLSLVPPLFFKVMNKHVDHALSNSN
ncbi:MAG: alkane 1-monooxygenase [Bacteroidetes bacterium]|nr:alkane 1-monooxygenase [Bacteroidota bacterium]